MCSFRKFVFVLSAFGFCSAALLPVPSVAETQTVRIGIMSFEAEGIFSTHIADEDGFLSQVPEWLQSHLPDVEFETRFLRMQNLMNAVKEKQVDIILGSSGLFWQLKAYGVRDLATIVSKETPNPNKGVAGVIFVRKDRDDIQSIADLRGMRAATGMPNMFLATQLSMAAIAKEGFEPETFFSNIKHYDLPYPQVYEDVLSGSADVGLFRACVLESEMPDWESKVKIINRQFGDDFFCARSTDAYPNFTIAAVAGFDPQIAKRIALALLLMPSVGESSYRWALATDFEKVDQVAKLLKTDGYSYLREWTLSRIWNTYRQEILIFCLLVILWFVHVWWRVERLVERRTQALKNEIFRRTEAEKSARKYEQRLEIADKLGTLGQLSTMFAHELRQPLATAQHLNDGIRVLLRRGRLDPDRINRCTQGISDQINKIDAIIERVRNYAKNNRKSNENVDLISVLNLVVRQIGLENIELDLTSEYPVVVKGDDLELELAFTNLLKNARQAVGNSGTVKVVLFVQEHYAVVVIENSGKKLSQSEVEDMCRPFSTDKKFGLGLGISIVCSIVGKHHGKIHFSSREEGGVKVEVALPLQCSEIRQRGK